MQGLKLIHVSKGAPGVLTSLTFKFVELLNGTKGKCIVSGVQIELSELIDR